MAPPETSIHDATGRSWLECDPSDGHGRYGLLSKFSSEPDPLVQVIGYERRSKVLTALEPLTPQQRQTLTRRFGLDGGGERTQAEVAAEMRISPQRVAQLESAALNQLRHTRIRRDWSEL